MNQQIEAALNDQINKEASSSQYYLAMASWAETNGLSGTAFFMYAHADEERFHMLKLVKFVNERGGRAIIPAIAQPPSDFDSVQRMFELLLAHELTVTASINDVVDICLKENSFDIQMLFTICFFFENLNVLKIALGDKFHSSVSSCGDSNSTSSSGESKNERATICL